MDAIRTHVRAECEGGCGRTHVRLGLDLGSLAADWTDPGLALRREDSRVPSGAVGVGQVHGRFPFCLAVISYPASPVPVYGNARGSSRTSSRRNRRIGLTAPVSPATQTTPSPGRPAGTAKCLLTVQSPGPSRCMLETGSWLERRASPSGEKSPRLGLPRYGDWEVIKGFCESPWETESRPYMKSLASARKELAWEVDHWIALSQVRPRISWNETVADWRCSLDALCTGPNLFGVLAVYLIGAIAAPGRGIAICSSCAQPYIPARRPDPNRNNSCRHCQGKSGKQAARRDAARRFRAKQRGRKLP